MEVVDSTSVGLQPLSEPQYYNPGSEIELSCVVRSREDWSTDVLWLKDGRPLDLNHRPTVR